MYNAPSFDTYLDNANHLWRNNLDRPRKVLEFQTEIDVKQSPFHYKQNSPRKPYDASTMVAAANCLIAALLVAENPILASLYLLNPFVTVVLLVDKNLPGLV